MAALLEVAALTVDVTDRRSGARHVLVEDIGFTLDSGETLGLVGESGSGKSVTSLAIMRLLARGLRIRAGSVLLDGEDLVSVPDRRMQAVRGDQIAMVFQEPMTSLDPAFTVGNQIAEAVLAHRDVSRAEARLRAVDMLDMVGIPQARDRLREYPHEFSGGMRQRVMIAMALACEPQVLIADEPTTAVDVTVQAQILELLRELRDELGMAVLFVTHDLGVVADTCDRVCALYAGQVVEEASVDEFFGRPRHPYSDGLLRATPQTRGTARRLHIIPGTVPTPDALPSGCRFHPRCDHALDRCAETAPDLDRTGSGGLVRCLREGELHLGTRT